PRRKESGPHLRRRCRLHRGSRLGCFRQCEPFSCQPSRRGRDQRRPAAGKYLFLVHSKGRGAIALVVCFAARTRTDRRLSVWTSFRFVPIVVTHPFHLVTDIPLVSALWREVE